MNVALAFFIIISYIVGILVGRFIDVKRIDGNLVIDDSDPEKDRWLFELNYSPSELTKQKNVKMKVVHRRITEADGWPNEN